MSTKVAPKYVRLAKSVVGPSGWKFEGQLPTERKFVCIAAPHTSNWDGLILVWVAQSLGLHLSFMVKKELVRGPLGALMNKFGAVPIDRSSRHNVVDQMIAEFNQREELALAVPPEGTRKRTEYWKSGFYHIALGADVPIVPGYLDYSRKMAGLGPAFRLTGDRKADMDKIRDFYRDKNPVARYPEMSGEIRLRDEEAE